MSYLFPNFKGCTVLWSLGMDKQFHITLHLACNCLSILGLKLILISKKGAPGDTHVCQLIGPTSDIGFSLVWHQTITRTDT